MPSKGKGKKKKTSSFTKNFMAGLLSISENYIKLQKLIDKMAGKVTYSNDKIGNINLRTDRVISDNLKTKTGEFIFVDGKPVKRGINYHIHYTKNLDEHYMTQSTHNNVTSKLIYRVKNTSTFSTYNSLNKQSPMILKSDVQLPTGSDYKKGSFTRYFAKKANEVMSKPFEINAKQMDKSPLYIYISIPWYIKGGRDLVRVLNSRSIRMAKEVMPNIGKYLNPFQLYRKSKALNNKKAILEKLGVVDYSGMEKTTFTIAGSTGTMGAGLVATLGGKKKKKGKTGKKKKKY